MKELKRFIRFNYRLYKGNPYSVPDLYDDMLNTFNKRRMRRLNSVKQSISWLTKTINSGPRSCHNQPQG